MTAPATLCDPDKRPKEVPLPPVVVIAGPTASGKSALALELAEAVNGTIINADSVQVYRDLPLLTAQPDVAATRGVPHRLYGILDAAERSSVGRWRDAAVAEIAETYAAGRVPIVVGGTGMYLRALTEGLADIPAVPPDIRAEAGELYRSLGGPAFRERLAALDPVAASRFPAGDRQRLTRAWEVVRATSIPIGEWPSRGTAAPSCRFASLLLMPPRDLLYAACNTRFSAMIESGALSEVAALGARSLDPDLPAMKAAGVPELLAHLRGDLSLDEAIAHAQQATRRYAKRQMTWFRHQMKPDLLLAEKYSESLLRCSRHFIDHFLLTHSP